MHYLIAKSLTYGGFEILIKQRKTIIFVQSRLDYRKTSFFYLKTKLENSIQTFQAVAHKEKLSTEKFEGLHIITWLIKDFCWCLDFKEAGVLMIVPTFILSLYFIYKTKNELKQLIINISLTFWITANSLWMLSEFFEFDQIIIYSLPIKYYYGVLFIMGLSTILSYYTYQLFYKKNIN